MFGEGDNIFTVSTCLQYYMFIGLPVTFMYWSCNILYRNEVRLSSVKLNDDYGRGSIHHQFQNTIPASVWKKWGKPCKIVLTIYCLQPRSKKKSLHYKGKLHYCWDKFLSVSHLIICNFQQDCTVLSGCGFCINTDFNLKSCCCDPNCFN
jgi:hypothetical protein